jgi:hypothetical protein
LYKLTSVAVHVMSVGRTGGLRQICGQRNFQGFVEVWFSIFLVIGGQGCPHILVDLYWLGGIGFPLDL